MPHDNERRRDIAREAREAYLAAKGERDDRDGTLIDMVADILHLAEAEGWDAARIIRCAVMNFEAEK